MEVIRPGVDCPPDILEDNGELSGTGPPVMGNVDLLFEDIMKTDYTKRRILSRTFCTVWYFLILCTNKVIL